MLGCSILRAKLIGNVRLLCCGRPRHDQNLRVGSGIAQPFSIALEGKTLAEFSRTPYSINARPAFEPGMSPAT